MEDGGDLGGDSFGEALVDIEDMVEDEEPPEEELDLAAIAEAVVVVVRGAAVDADDCSTE